MQRLFWEHFKGAMGDLVVCLGVLLWRVRLCFVRLHNLNVTFGPESATVNHGYSGLNTFLIDVKSCLHIVKSISDDCLILEKCFRVDIGSALMDLVESCGYVPFQVLVHLDCRGCRCWRFWLSQMLFSEQELPIEVANLNNIGISEDDMPIFSSTDTKHRIVFEKLTSDSPSSNHKQLAILNLLVKIFTKQGHLCEFSLSFTSYKFWVQELWISNNFIRYKPFFQNWIKMI